MRWKKFWKRSIFPTPPPTWFFQLSLGRSFLFLSPECTESYILYRRRVHTGHPSIESGTPLQPHSRTLLKKAHRSLSWFMLPHHTTGRLLWITYRALDWFCWRGFYFAIACWAYVIPVDKINFLFNFGADVVVRIYAGYLEVITVNRDVILCLLIGGTQSCPRSPPDSTVFFF